jgi:hypothetical protein
MPRVVRCALTGDEVAVSMPRRSPLADQSNASRTLEMQHRFARCDADWAEEAIAANRKGESGDELGQGWGKGKVATRLGKALTTCLPSPASGETLAPRRSRQRHGAMDRRATHRFHQGVSRHRRFSNAKCRDSVLTKYPDAVCSVRQSAMMSIALSN